MAIILSGQPVAEQLQSDIRKNLARLSQAPQLAIIIVGQNPASLTYIKYKQKMAAKLGIKVVMEQFGQDASTQVVIEAVQKHNQMTTTGILVQLPLPAHINTQQVLESISPNKDVDGLSPINLGRLLSGHPSLVPATARGVLAMLEYYQIPVAGRQVVMVGRSRLVGQPVAQLLLQHQATVTIAHRRTSYLSLLTKTADILIVATGQPGLIGPDMVKPGATVIDVGLTKTSLGPQGDVDPSVTQVAGAISPVPGGVGPLTVTCLMQNILQAAELQSKI